MEEAREHPALRPAPAAPCVEAETMNLDITPEPTDEEREAEAK